MYPSSSDSIVAFAKGPKGDAGDVSTAQLNAAIAALKAGVDPAGDTLAELYALILARAPLDLLAAFSVSPTVPTLAPGNNSSKVANSAYVRQELINYAVAITGSTMTGPLILNADPSAALGAATKQYADALIQGISNKYSALCATTTTLPANTYANGASGVGATLTANANGALTVDAQSPAVNQYVLVKNEAAGANNGLYKMTQAGDASHPYILTRATVDDTAAEMAGAFCFVELGTVNNKTGWLCAQSTITIGTTAIVFSQFSGAGTYTAGAGLTLTGLQFSIGNNALTYSFLQQGTALSVPGVAGNATANLADIVAASDKQVFRRSGTTLGFGAIDVSSASAVTGTLAVANGGSGAATFTQYGVLLGNGTAAFTQVLPTGGNSGLAYQSQGSALPGIFAQLGNTALVNSAVTIGSTSVSLGGTAATVAGLTLTSPVINTADARGAWTAGATWTLPAHTLGGTVSGGGNAINNLSTLAATTSLTSPLHVGGSATGQVLTLQSTTGVGSGDAINLALGNNGARIAARLTQTGLGINTAANPSVDFAVGGIGGSNAGFEVSVSTNVSVQAYNRNTSAYAALTFDATTVAFRPSGAAAVLMQASGCLSVGSGANDNGAGNIAVTGGIQPGTFTVGTLPSGVPGKTVNCSNARAYNGAGVQEGAGGGTGSLVSYNTTWKVVGTNQTAVA